MTDDAPGDLELVRAFVNTVDLEAGPEQLTDPAALAAWLRTHGLIAEADPVGGDDLQRALRLREALRALCWANNGADLAPAAAETLDGAAERAGLRVRFRASGAAEVAPSRGGVDGAWGRMLAIVAESMRAGTWSRLKACRSEVCGWAFYDRSRNRSGAWCSMAVCGNRAKARSFRARRASASDST